jgi:hypothetical protein
MSVHPTSRSRRPWNKGLLIGQKKPLEPKHVWSIRVRLEIAGSRRDLAIFNLAIDSKLRACDLSSVWMTFVQDSKCGIGRRSSRRRLVDRSNLRSRSSQEIPLKLGCQCSGLLVPDFSFQVDFVQVLTFLPANMPEWCIAGSKA